MECFMIYLDITVLVSILLLTVDGKQYWWGYAESFFISEKFVKTCSKLDEVKSRSFVECYTKCDVSQGCIGVAYRAGECNLLNGTACSAGGCNLRIRTDKLSLKTRNDNNTDYKVMVYDATPESKYSDCKYLLSIGCTGDGVYTVNPDDTVPFEAYCDMASGGWTVFQRRQDNSTDFYRGWADYVDGFGSLTGNLWAGLEHLHVLTSVSDTELHVYMDTFEGEIAEAKYSSFSVGSASDDYALSVSGYNGTAGDSLTYYQNGLRFATYDHETSNMNCSNSYKGAWWYGEKFGCHASNLNGQYLSGNHTSYADGINWYTFKGHYYSLKTTVMKLRRK